MEALQTNLKRDKDKRQQATLSNPNILREKRMKTVHMCFSYNKMTRKLE